jgi:hypothetical protein
VTVSFAQVVWVLGIVSIVLLFCYVGLWGMCKFSVVRKLELLQLLGLLLSLGAQVRGPTALPCPSS